MAEPIEMPKLSDTMTSGTIVKWLKKEGDSISESEEIAELETDKATMPLEAFDAGVLLKIMAPEGAVVPCGAPLAFVGKKGEAIPEDVLKEAEKAIKADVAAEPVEAPATAATSSEGNGSPKPAAATAASPAATIIATPPPEPQTSRQSLTTPSGRIKASPLARKIADERGIDLSALEGSGPGGRIVKNDVMATANGRGGMSLMPTGPIAAEERLPASGMRKTIAARLLESKATIPHFYLTVEADMKPLMDLRASVNTTLNAFPKPHKFSVNDFILRAVTLAMREVPGINAAWAGDAIIQYGSVHLAMAVAIKDGLITPVIRNAESKSMHQLSLEARDLAMRAREGKLKPNEYQGGTFTISNMGMLGVDNFDAIVNPPQAAILAVSSIVKKPVVDADDNIVVGHRMNLNLSCDHRVVDGALAAHFMSALRKYIEAPAGLLL